MGGSFTVKKHLITTTALVAAFLGAYQRRAYAACSTTGTASYLCTGAVAGNQTFFSPGNPDLNVTIDTGAHLTGSVAMAGYYGGNTYFHVGGDINLSADVRGGGVNYGPSSIYVVTDAGTQIGGVLSTKSYVGNTDVVVNGNTGGIYTLGDPGAADINITVGSTSTISGQIRAINNGTGATYLDIQGHMAYNSLISIFSMGTDVYVHSASELSTANTQSVYILNRGSGYTTVILDGDVTTGDGPAIDVYGQHDVTLVTQGVHGGLVANGFPSLYSNWAITASAGDDLDLKTYGDIDGYGGIAAWGNNVSIAVASGTTITTTATPAGAVAIGTGIYANANGAMSITLDGDIDASMDGIRTAGTASTTIITNGDIDAGQDGIRVAGGPMTIKTYGTVNAGDSAIRFAGVAGATSVEVHDTVYGGQDGIWGWNTGNVTVTTDNGVAVTGKTRYGIVIASGTADASVTTNGDVYGAVVGIGASTSGYSGNVHVTANGDVYSGGYGISTSAVRGKTYIDVASGADITGVSDDGIKALGGRIYMDIQGNVTGARGIYAFGVVAPGGIYSTDLLTAAGTKITGTVADGIFVKQSMGVFGDVRITTNGEVEGNTNGIYGSVYGANYAARYLTITANDDVTANATAIKAMTKSGGATITTGAGANLNAQSGDGIYLYGYQDTAASSIHVDGDITAGNNGVYANIKDSKFSIGNVDLIIDTDANSSIIAGADGIRAYSRAQGIISINALGAIDAADNGIFVKGGIRPYLYNGNFYGSMNMGIQVVTGAADIEGHNGAGIKAENAGYGPMTIHTQGNVKGSTDGINAYSAIPGGYSMTITTDAGTTVTGTARDGIHAYNYQSGGFFGSNPLVINANGDVDGGRHGIFARNYYGRDTDINIGAQAHIIGAAGDGVHLEHYGQAANLVVDGDILGSQNGINISAYAGDPVSVSINSGGHVTGTTGDGVRMLNSGANVISFVNDGGTVSGVRGLALLNGSGGGGTAVNNTNSTITGSDTGVYIDGNALQGGSLTNRGTISGGTGPAIDLHNLTGATDINIEGGHVIGDVVDNHAANGFSTVNITGNFTSEGDFDVSDFNVASSKNFIFGAGKSVASVNGVDNDGTMTVNAAGSSITGDLDINSGGRFNSNAVFSVAGNITNNGTLAISKNMTVDTMAAGTGALTFGVASAADHGQLTLTSGAANLSGQSLFIDVATSNTLTKNETIKIVDGQGAIVGGPGSTRTAVADNSFIYDFDIVDGTGFAGSNSSDLFLVSRQSTEANSVVNNADGAIASVLEVSGHTLDLTSMRLEDLGRWDGYSDVTGFAEGEGGREPGLTWSASFGDDTRAGDPFADLSYQGGKEWQQIFGHTSHQGTRDGIDGHKTTTLGGAFGADTGNIFSSGTFGVAFSYANSRIQSNSPGTSMATVDSYQLTLYGDHKLGEHSYVSGMLAYVWNNNNTMRYNVGAPGVTALGEFDSNQIASRVEVGKHIKMGRVTLTPNARLSWMHYMADDYTETGAGGLNLNVKTQDLDKVEAGVGLKLSTLYTLSETSKIIPSLQVGYRRAIVNDAVELNSSLTGGGSAFTLNGMTPAADTFNVGTTVKFIASEKIDVIGSYNFDYKEDYSAHSGFIRLSYKFN